MTTDNTLLSYYMKGFKDELNGTSTTMPSDALEIKAYNLGAAHALVGDDVRSVDYLTYDEILKIIKKDNNMKPSGLTDDQLLEKYGWIMECISPFEVRHTKDGSFASGQAAYLVLDDLREQERTKIIELTVDEIKTLISDAGEGQTGWSDSSYKIIEFIGGDPTAGF